MHNVRANSGVGDSADVLVVANSVERQGYLTLG